MSCKGMKGRCFALFWGLLCRFLFSALSPSCPRWLSKANPLYDQCSIWSGQKLHAGNTGLGPYCLKLQMSLLNSGRTRCKPSCPGLLPRVHVRQAPPQDTARALVSLHLPFLSCLWVSCLTLINSKLKSVCSPPTLDERWGQGPDPSHPCKFGAL